MALFKIYRGNETNLPSEMNDGWAYFCTDTGNFYIDFKNSSGALYRTHINSEYAYKLRYLDGGTTVEVDPAELVGVVNNKVDKVAGKWLSTNDYTTTEKEKLAGIESGATKTTVDAALSGSSTNPVQNKVINSKLIEISDELSSIAESVDDKADSKHDHAVADISDLTITATELNYMDGVTSNVQSQLNKKANDFTIELYNGTAGNPKPVKFATVKYSTCNSENGVAIKIGMVSGHGNGTSYAFLQDVIIKVNYNGGVEANNFKYYGANTTYDGARQFGDIFWVVDTANKVVDFYCLMGQYARLNMVPYKKLTYSSGGTVTQYTSCTVYSSGMKTWANNSNIALTSNIDSVVSTLNSAINKKADRYDVADLHVWRRRFHDPSLPFCGSRTEWCSIVTSTDTSLSYSDTISCLENGVFLVDPITITVSSEDDPVLDKIKGKYIYSNSHNTGFVSYVDRNAVFVKEVIGSDWLISTTGYIISADTDFVDEFDYVTSIRADEYTYPGKSYSSYEYEEHSDGCYYQYCGRLGSLLKLNIDGDIKSISSSTDQTITLDVENNGTEYRLFPYGGTRTLTINLSIAHSELAETDRASYTIVFVSESIATTMTDNVGIYFTGDNTSNGVFTPEAYATYELKIWWNGISWQGSVRASNVLAST